MKHILNFLSFILALLLVGCSTSKKPQTHNVENGFRPIVWDSIIGFNTGDTAIVIPAVSFSVETHYQPYPGKTEIKTDLVIDTLDVSQIIKDTSNTTDTIYYLGERVCNCKTGLTEKVSVMQIETFIYHPEALTQPGVTIFVESEIKYFTKSEDADWSQIFTFEDFVWIKQESHQ
jgi:hypothetical protein